jgi:hypothetical protein
MSAVRTDSHLTDAEFKGMARTLRDRMAAASIVSTPLMITIYHDASATLQRRKRQHAAFRPDHLLEFERRWMAIPHEERLRLDVKRSKTGLVITEARVSSMVLTNTAWRGGQKELDLVIAGMRLTLGAKKVRAETYPLAVVSLHAVSRRYRRGFSNEHAAIMGDLTALAQVEIPDAPTPEFFVTAPSGGEWRGSVMRFADLERKESIVFAVRTFV